MASCAYLFTLERLLLGADKRSHVPLGKNLPSSVPLGGSGRSRHYDNWWSELQGGNLAMVFRFRGHGADAGVQHRMALVCQARTPLPTSSSLDSRRHGNHLDFKCSEDHRPDPNRSRGWPCCSARRLSLASRLGWVL